MHCLAGLEPVSSGEISYQGQLLTACTQQDLYRHHIGFIFQHHYLLPDFNVLDNVALAAMIAGKSRHQAYHDAQASLSACALAHHVNAPITILSVGERQRVSIARAIVNQPALLFADEPTAQLDADTAKTVLDLLMQLCQEEGMAMVCVSHDVAFYSGLSHHYVLKDHQLICKEASVCTK